MWGTLVRCCASTRHEAARVDVHAGRLGADAVAVRAAPDGDEHAREHVGVRRLRTLEGDVQPVLQRLDRGDLRRQEDVLVLLLDAACERLHQLGIGAGQQDREQLDDRHARAQRREDRRHLEPDDPAADHQQALGDLGERERRGRVHDARIVRAAREAQRA